LIDYQALSTLHHLQKLCNLVGVTSSSGVEEEEGEGEKDDSGHLDFRANIRKFNALLAQTPKYQALLTLVADSLPNIPTTEVRYYLPFLYLRYSVDTCRHCGGSRIRGLVHFLPLDPGLMFFRIPDPTYI
jgi:hypothetical protein